MVAAIGRASEQELVFEENCGFSAIARRPCEEVHRWEEDGTVLIRAAPDDLEELVGNGRDGTYRAVRSAAECEDAVSLLFGVLDVLLVVIRVVVSSTVWWREVGATAIEDTNDINARFSSQCAQLLFQGEEDLCGPRRSVAHDFSEVLHDSMPGIVDEDQGLLLAFVPLCGGEAISVLEDVLRECLEIGIDDLNDLVGGRTKL